MEAFSSERPLHDLLVAVSQQVAEADAAFQVAQRRDWNRVIQGSALLEGYDRLLNLGVTEVKVSLRLLAVRPGWLRRQWDRCTGHETEPLYRLARGNEPASLTLTALIRRNGDGRWSTTTEPSGETAVLPARVT